MGEAGFRNQGQVPHGRQVLVVSGLYPRPGDRLSGLFVHRQVAELRAQGVDARVLCPVVRHALPFREESDFAESLDGCRMDHVDGVPVTFMPYWHVPHRLSARLEAMSLLRGLRSAAGDVFERRPDVIHAHWLFPAGYGAVALASEWGVPSVVTAHGSDVHRYPARNRGVARFTRRTVRRANRVVGVCRALAQQIEELAGQPIAGSVVYSGIDSEHFHPPTNGRRAVRRELGLPETGTGVCSVSRLVREKGVRELLEAFRRLAVEYPELWIALVGEGPLREELRAIAEAHGLSDRVFLPGEVSHEDVGAWMRACDLFALPSYAEGLPVVVLEAMACGLPVVATRVGGIPEVVNESVGFLVASRDAEGVAGALNELLDDPARRRAMGAEAVDLVRDNFTWRRSAESLIDVYREVLGAEEPRAETAIEV